MVQIEDVIEVRKAAIGYEIIFPNNKKIWLTKRRTIPALLMLIKYGVCSETDLARGSERLQEIKAILENKIDPACIQDHYADANKPFSELWNEEGFTWIHPAQEKLAGNQKYVLREDDHEKLFGNIRKAFRKTPSPPQQAEIIKSQDGLCNFCGAVLRPRSKITKTTFAKDRVRVVIDHRVPVEKGGNSTLANYQAICFYCNKCKWQICNICPIADCSSNCALANPEKSNIIAPTKEDISDRLKHK